MQSAAFVKLGSMQPLAAICIGFRVGGKAAARYVWREQQHRVCFAQSDGTGDGPAAIRYTDRSEIPSCWAISRFGVLAFKSVWT